MATQIHLQLPRSKMPVVYRREQHSRHLLPDAEDFGVSYACDNPAAERIRFQELSGRLLELLLEHHGERLFPDILDTLLKPGITRQCARTVLVPEIPPEPVTSPSRPVPTPCVLPQDCGAFIPPVRTASATILHIVARHFNVLISDLKSVRREAPVCYARHVAMYLIYRLTPMSFPKMGVVMGGRDHSTIWHGVRRITERRKADPKCAADIAAILKRIAAADPSLVEER